MKKYALRIGTVVACLALSSLGWQGCDRLEATRITRVTRSQQLVAITAIQVIQVAKTGKREDLVWLEEAQLGIWQRTLDGEWSPEDQAYLAAVSDTVKGMRSFVTRPTKK